MNKFRCKSRRHYTDEEHDGKECPYDNMSARELSEELKQEVSDKPLFIRIQLFANKNLSKMKEHEIAKSIKSFNKQKSVHLEKIKNYPNSVHREHWEKEIVTLDKNIKEYNEELKKRR